MKFFKKLWKLLCEPYVFVARCLPLQDKIVFCNYHGNGFADDPKYIALELMKRKTRAKLVWMLQDMSTPLPEGITKVKYASARAKWHLYTAKVWIYNFKDAYKVKRKRRGQFYIQTWHGSFCTKHLEQDCEQFLNRGYLRATKADSAKTDLMYSNNDFTINLFKTKFWYSGPVIKSDSPQLSVVVNTPADLKDKVYKTLGLNPEDKIVLYAPTFRESGKLSTFFWEYEKILPVLEERFGGRFVFLLRLHPHMADKWEGLKYSDRVVPASTYPDMDELIAVSDVMISDFSGVIFDMGIKRGPVFLYAEDCRDYVEHERQQYMTVDELPFTMATDLDGLAANIRAFDPARYNAALDAFWARIGLVEHGHGPERITDIVERQLDGQSPLEGD